MATTDVAGPEEGTGPATGRPRRRALAIWSWVSYDWGGSAFSAVINTFVFTTYLTDAVAAEDGRISGATALAIASACAGVVIALSAPFLGQRADTGGRKRSLAVWTAVVIAATYLMFLVRPDPAYLLFGLILFAVGNIASEIANVSYYAMLNQVADEDDIGRVSGLGWAMGYVGSIFLLLVAYFGLIAQPNWFGVPDTDGWGVRIVCLVVATWFLVFAVPVFLTVPEPPARQVAERPDGRTAWHGMADAVRRLVRDVVDLWHRDRDTVWFLIASAIYRDGLAAVFTFGGVLAVSVYGMPAATVLIFGVGANVVAAAGAALGGRLEDRIGPKAVILGSIAGLLVSALALLFVRDLSWFWVFGLALCAFVGPAQASSRSFLAQKAPDRQEGQMFGLYATAGRAVSFVSPTLFGLFALLTGADRWGTIGIIIVLAVGGAILLRVPDPHRRLVPDR